MMSQAAPPVSDMLVTVKSRGVQRALLAEMRGDREAAGRHFLAAAHLELVLVDDYRRAGDADMAARSQLSAASCFWRAGDRARAEPWLNALEQAEPAQAPAVRQVRAELARDYPALAS
jgi:hypothetical protein